jgi:hypothetical protein
MLGERVTGELKPHLGAISVAKLTPVHAGWLIQMRLNQMRHSPLGSSAAQPSTLVSTLKVLSPGGR